MGPLLSLELQWGGTQQLPGVCGEVLDFPVRAEPLRPCWGARYVEQGRQLGQHLAGLTGDFPGTLLPRRRPQPLPLGKDPQKPV